MADALISCILVLFQAFPSSKSMVSQPPEAYECQIRKQHASYISVEMKESALWCRRSAKLKEHRLETGRKMGGNVEKACLRS